MTSGTAKNFDDFNNMFKGIDRKDCASTYIATLVVDKVKLERNPFRSYDVDLWYDEIFYGRIDMTPISDNFGLVYTDDVSDIED